MPGAMGLVSGRPRRRPFPFDMVVSGITGITGDTGLMLGKLSRDEPGLIAKDSPSRMNVQPTEFSYSAQDPQVEQTFVWDDWSLGFGLANQRTQNDRRYWYALSVDASVRGQLMPGPNLTYPNPATSDTVEGCAGFFEIDGSLYLLNGRYVLVRAEVQTITESGTPTGGTFTITYAGNTTSALGFDVSAAAMQTALRLLAGFESVTVTRTGASNYVWTIVTRGAGNNPAQVTTTDSLTGGVSPATTPATSATVDADGGWTVDLDLGANMVARDVVVFKQNGGSTTYAYIAFATNAGTPVEQAFYRFDGTTYTQHASLTCLCFAAVGRELYRGGHSTNLVAKVDTNSDPWTAGNWTAANSFYIGDSSSPVIKMHVTISGTLLIFKTDGVYVLDEDGQDIKLFHGFGTIPNHQFALSAKYQVVFNYGEHTYFVMNNMLWRMDMNYVVEHIGPERNIEDGTVVYGKGVVTAGVATQFVAYVSTKTLDGGSGAHILKFGAWVPDGNNAFTRIDAWHGDISDGIGQGLGSITAMYVSSLGADAAHQRLYLATLSGDVAFFALPCSYNPLNCSSYRFDADGSYTIAFPKWHGGYPADIKHLRSMTISGATISSTNRPRALLNGNLSNDFTGDVTRIDVDSAWVAAEDEGVLHDVELQGLQNSQTAPFVIRSVALAFAVRPPVMMIWKFAALCENGLLRRDGTPMRIGADRIRAVVQAMADTDGSVTVITPEETSALLAITSYSEGYAWDDDAHQWRAALLLEAVETVKGDEVLVA